MKEKDKEGEIKRWGEEREIDREREGERERKRERERVREGGGVGAGEENTATETPVLMDAPLTELKTDGCDNGKIMIKTHLFLSPARYSKP